MVRAWPSERMQRAIMGDCVAWKPEMAPQAMVTNSSGQSGVPLGCRLAMKSPGFSLGSTV